MFILWPPGCFCCVQYIAGSCEASGTPGNLCVNIPDGEERVFFKKVSSLEDLKGQGRAAAA